MPPPGRLLSNAVSSQHTYLRPKLKFDIFVIYLSITYFVFQFPPFVSFYSMADERQLK